MNEENKEIEMLNNNENVIKENKNVDLTNKSLYIRVQNVIRDAKIKKYVNESASVSAEGITFLGTFTGKNNLQLERMKNIKLRIELLQTKKIELKDSYEKVDMMADLYACAISEFNGNFTDEMKKMYDSIKENGESVTDENVQSLARNKIEVGQSYLPIIHQEKPKGIFGDIKIQTEFYKIENKRLENQIILERGKGQFGTFEYTGKNAGIIIPTCINSTKK